MALQNRSGRKARASVVIPEREIRALKQMAQDNGRSMMSEIRIAIHNHLKKDGRII